MKSSFPEGGCRRSVLGMKSSFPTRVDPEETDGTNGLRLIATGSRKLNCSEYIRHRSLAPAVHLLATCFVDDSRSALARRYW